MLSPTPSKKNSNIPKNPSGKIAPNHQKPQQTHNQCINRHEKESNQIKRILIQKMIENDRKMEKFIDQGLETINLVAKFSQKFELSLKLPSSLTILQLNQILSSYSKLHLKNCSSHQIYTGIYVPSPFEKKNMILIRNGGMEMIAQEKDEIHGLALQISKFIHQNTLLSQKFTELDHKSCFHGSQNHQFSTLGNLLMSELQILTKLNDRGNMLFESANQDEEKLQDNIVVRIRYDSRQPLSDGLDKNENKVKELKTKQLFSGKDIKTLNYKLLEGNARPFPKHYDTIEPISVQNTANQHIYIKEYTQGSEYSSIQSIKSGGSHQQMTQHKQYSGKNLITFDPKQILDSGRLRAENKSIQALMRWFKEGYIVDYLLLKDLIVSGESFTQETQKLKKFMHFPIRLRGSSDTVEIYVAQINRIRSGLLCQMNQLIKKIIQSDLVLSCSINEYYLLQSSYESNPAKVSPINLKNQAQTQEFNIKHENTSKYHIFIAQLSPVQQITLPQYLSSILKTLISKKAEDRDKASVQLRFNSIKQFIGSIYHQVQSLLQQLISFGNHFMIQLKHNLYLRQPLQRDFKKLNSNKTNQDKNSKSTFSLFQTYQFWQISPNQKLQFINNSNTKKLPILSLFICKQTSKSTKNPYLHVNFPQFLKRIISFYQKHNQHKLIKIASKQQKINTSQFIHLLKTRLKTQLSFLIKSYCPDKGSQLIYNEILNQIHPEISLRNKHTQEMQINRKILVQDLFITAFMTKTSEFLSQMTQQNNICLSNKVQSSLIEEVQSGKQFSRPKSIYSKLNQHFSTYHSLKSVQFSQLGNLLCKSIKFESLKVQDHFTQPKMLYFSSGQNLDIYEKETTLKKKISSQSTSHNNSKDFSHKNSLELHPSIYTTSFDPATIFTGMNKKSQKASHLNQKSFVEQKSLRQKQNNRQNHSMKRDKKESNTKGNSKALTKKSKKKQL